MTTRAPMALPPQSAEWVSNETLDRIAELLRDSKRVVLLTHSKPDGDAAGSVLALARALHRLRIEAVPVFLNPWSPRFDGLVGSTKVIHEHKHTWNDPFFESVDRIAICDTGSWQQLADAKPWLEPRAASAVLLDHHAHGDPAVAAHRYVDVTAAAACEIVAELCVKLLGVSDARRLPVEIAEPLYLGVATDTGWFHHSNMTSRSLRLAADLVEAGVDHNKLYRTTEQAERVERLRLMGRGLRSLELHAGDTAAVISISQSDLAETGATLDEAGGLNDLPMTVASVRVSAVLIETEHRLTKISLRSKAGDGGERGIDVNRIAQTLGGGGHFHAAGAKLQLPLAEAKARVIAAITAPPKP
ncbi:MAG TPA: DHH family phosphoesterase [Phycisphaerales bacterium]|nr:DHH family phosphoesterase [Phycisphaerales bacterium]